MYVVLFFFFNNFRLCGIFLQFIVVNYLAIFIEVVLFLTSFCFFVELTVCNT